MPTKHPRHMVTETPPVRDSLDALRAELGRQRLDMAELVLLGAEVKLAQVRRGRPEAAAARAWLAQSIRERSLSVDRDAADAVKRAGLIERGQDAAA